MDSVGEQISSIVADKRLEQDAMEGAEEHEWDWELEHSASHIHCFRLTISLPLFSCLPFWLLYKAWKHLAIFPTGNVSYAYQIWVA